MKIILLGYMASGKSTIGKFLSSSMFMPFIDLDEYIEAQEKKSISDIFKLDGEIYFRLKEHQYLKELLQNDERFILSLGGGTPCYANNMELILKQKNVISIYLRASIKTLVKRLQKNRNKRPIVASFDNEQLTEFIAKHLFERQYFYNKANKKIEIDEKSIQEIVAELSVMLH